MAETITIDAAYVQTYERNVRHLAQQGYSKLRGRVMERSESSQYHNWERFGALTANTKSSQRQATPTDDQSWTRRVSTPQTRDMGAAVEQEDVVQMLIDPNSTIAMAQAMGMARAVDDIIIDAATGTALDEDGNAVAFPAGQVIGDGTGAIDTAMVKDVLELFYANDIGPEIPKVFVIGEVQLRALMEESEFISRDFNPAQILASGVLNNFLGFDWLVHTGLNAPGAGSLSCLAFTPFALGLQVNRDITTRVAEDPSLSFAWRIYTYLTMGCVRVEDAHIVHVHVLDS